jgi:UDP-2-acetamido-3-amino-2,3-dideoxy-glucuronate N-acetyltransferase
MIASNVILDEGVIVHHPDLVNLYGCKVGAGSRIGTFVEIQKNAASAETARSPATPSSAKAWTIEDGVFVGHGVMFTNDLNPRAVNLDGELAAGRWRLGCRSHAWSSATPPSAAMRRSSRV